MSGQQPPPEGPSRPEQPEQPAGAEWLDVGRTEPSGNRGGRRGIVAGAVGGVLLLLVAGGAVFAYQALSGGGPQPETAIPDTAFAYARVDLDPSAEQKVNTLRLLQKFPEFSEETGITSDRDDLRKLIFEEAISSSGCELSYADDVEPWLGDRAAVAALPDASDDGEPDPIVTIQVTDETAAEDAVATLQSCALGGSEVEEVGVAFVGEYMVLAETQELADHAAEDAEASPLVDADQFSADMDALDEAGLASYWLDLNGLVTAMEDSGEVDSQELAQVQKVIDTVQLDSTYGAFRAGDDYLEMVLGVSTDLGWEAEGNPIVDLPETTVGAFSLSGADDLVDPMWSALEESVDATSPGSFDQMVAQVEAESGLTLPDDLRTLLGDNVTVAIDSRGLDPDTMANLEDPSALNFGMRLSGDKEAVQTLVDRLQQMAQDQGVPYELVTSETDDGVVVATNQEYADELAGEGGLGDSEEFSSAVPDAEDAGYVMYVDLNGVQDIASAFVDDAAEVDRVLGPLKSVGITAFPVEDGYQESVFRLTFD